MTSRRALGWRALGQEAQASTSGNESHGTSVASPRLDKLASFLSPAGTGVPLEPSPVERQKTKGRRGEGASL